MPSTTTRLAIPYPVSTDTPNIPGDVQNLAARLDAICVVFSQVTTLPAAGNQGYLYLRTGDSTLWYDTGAVLEPLNLPVTRTVTIPHAWAITGPFDPTSGSDTFLPPLVVPVPSGQTVSLVEVFASVRSGSATVSMQAGGVTVPGLGAMSVTTTQTKFTPTGGSPTFTDGEQIAPTVTAISGNPDGLSVTAVLSYSTTVQD